MGIVNMIRSQRVGNLRRPAQHRAGPRGVAVLLGLVLGLAALPPAAEAAGVAVCTATPFRNDVANHVVYRIPALVATPRGTLLAFAERRRSTDPASDISDTEIVLARSTDRGCHWSAPRVIADQGTGTVGNPAPVVDTTTGAVLLFTVYRAPGGTTGHGFHLQRSTDDGLTFTPYSKAGKDLAGTPGWSGGLTGPGHAIQLHSPSSPHRGRIVVPMGYKDGDRYGAYAVVSDDHGVTWKVGYKAAGSDGRIEGTVAELPDGRLWISYRNRNANTAVGAGRISAWSSDGGSTLDAPFTNAGLPVVSVQSSSLALTGSNAGALLFSAPARKDATRRAEMSLFTSRGTSAGRTWGARYDVQLDARPAAYSDLAQLDDATVGLLYETGQTSWHERINFRSLRIADVLGRSQVSPALSVTTPSQPRAGAELRPTLLVRVPGTSAPAGGYRVRLRGGAIDRSQTLPLVAASAGRRVASLGTLPKGTYRLEVTYVGTSRIRDATLNRTITVS